MQPGIEWQVTDLPLSKKLKELEVPQDSVWYWWQDGCEAHKKLEPMYYIAREESNPCDIKIASAFTCAELGEMLPKNVMTGKQRVICQHGKDREYYYVCSDEDSHREIFIPFKFAETEAQARGKMLAYLIEKGIVKVSDLRC